MNLLNLQEFLDRNPCLNDYWKTELISLIQDIIKENETTIYMPVCEHGYSYEFCSMHKDRADWIMSHLKTIGFEDCIQSNQTQNKLKLEDFMQFVETHEGFRDIVYTDTRGNPTIGVGFNLNRYDAKEKLRQYGYVYETVLNGIQVKKDILYEIFKLDIIDTIKAVTNIFSDFALLPNDVQLILVDMCFNLGVFGLQKFQKMIAAIKEKDYKKAAEEMIDSKWYSQVGNRSKKLAEMMQNVK